jgi:hypothetical protein
VQRSYKSRRSVRKHSTSYIGMFGYAGMKYSKECSSEVR